VCEVWRQEDVGQPAIDDGESAEDPCPRGRPQHFGAQEKWVMPFEAMTGRFW